MQKPSNVKPVLLVQTLFIVLLIYLSYELVNTPQPWIFIDNANLLIHEMGHVVFTPFGQFVYLLGGSLFQVIVPLFIGIYFFLNKKYFSAGFSLFWLGDNLISVSVYIKDANSMSMPLLGEIHDWNWLLGQLNLLSYDQLLGNSIFIIGCLCPIISILWLILQVINDLVGGITFKIE